MVNLSSAAESVKLAPTMFFNFEVVVLNKLWLPVLDVPITIVSCLLFNDVVVAFVSRLLFIVVIFVSIFDLSYVSLEIVK